MDETTKSTTPVESPRPARDLDSWRGDIRPRPSWRPRRRPSAERVRDLWHVTKPLLARIGEGTSWE